MDKIDLRKINIKREDLTEVQVAFADELNESIDYIERLLRESLKSVSPYDISISLSKMSGYFSRIGSVLADLEYEHTKIVDEGDTKFNNEYEKQTLADISATAAKQIAESSLDDLFKKRKRIAKWLYSKAKYIYAGTEKMIHSVNRHHDNLKAELPMGKFQT